MSLDLVWKLERRSDSVVILLPIASSTLFCASQLDSTLGAAA
jgi:hypothetical protein